MKERKKELTCTGLTFPPEALMLLGAPAKTLGSPLQSPLLQLFHSFQEVIHEKTIIWLNCLSFKTHTLSRINKTLKVEKQLVLNFLFITKTFISYALMIDFFFFFLVCWVFL